MQSGTFDFNLKKQADFFKLCTRPCGLEKQLKFIMASFFLQQQFTFYLHLDVLGALHVRKDHFDIFSTFYREAEKSQ